MYYPVRKNTEVCWEIGLVKAAARKKRIKDALIQTALISNFDLSLANRPKRLFQVSAEMPLRFGK